MPGIRHRQIGQRVRRQVVRHIAFLRAHIPAAQPHRHGRQRRHAPVGPQGQHVLGRHFHRLAHQRRIGVGRDLRIDEGVGPHQVQPVAQIDPGFQLHATRTLLTHLDIEALIVRIGHADVLAPQVEHRHRAIHAAQHILQPHLLLVGRFGHEIAALRILPAHRQKRAAVAGIGGPARTKLVRHPGRTGRVVILLHPSHTGQTVVDVVARALVTQTRHHRPAIIQPDLVLRIQPGHRQLRRVVALVARIAGHRHAIDRRIQVQRRNGAAARRHVAVTGARIQPGHHLVFHAPGFKGHQQRGIGGRQVVIQLLPGTAPVLQPLVGLQPQQRHEIAMALFLLVTHVLPQRHAIGKTVLQVVAHRVLLHVVGTQRRISREHPR